MAGLSGTFSIGVNGAGMTGRIKWVETTDEASNSSSVKAYFQVSKASNSVTTYGSFSGYITIDGQRGNWSGTVSVPPGASNQTIFTVTKTVAHAADGSATNIRIITDGSVSGTTWTDSYGSEYIDLTKFNRAPSQPSGAPTFSRISPGTSLTITSKPATSTATITDYEYQQSSTTSFTGATAVSMGTDGIADVSGLTGAQTYYYQTRAKSSYGTGPWSATGTSAGITGSVNSFNVPAFAFLTLPYYGQVTFTSGGTLAVESPVGSPGGTAGLPPGVTLNTSTGELSGVPTSTGEYYFRISSNGTVFAPSSTTNFYIKAANPAPKIITGTSPFATSRSTLKVRDAGAWVAAKMLVYDTTYTNPDTSVLPEEIHWRQIT
jgi:hypothetical protein